MRGRPKLRSPFGSLAGALLGLVAFGAAAGAQPGSWPDGEFPFQPPPSLPESVNGHIRARTSSVSPRRVERLRDVFAAIRACWRVPKGPPGGDQITLRMSFKRSGEVLGKPRITFYKPGSDASRREAFRRSVLLAFQSCTPLPFSPSFGAAVAGRPFTFRFTDDRAA